MRFLISIWFAAFFMTSAAHAAPQLITLTMDSVTTPVEIDAFSTGSIAVVGGKPVCGNVTIQKRLDYASTILLRYLFTGKHIQNASIHFTMRNADGIYVNYYDVHLQDVLVTGVTQADSSSTPALTESIQLNVARYRYEFHGEKSFKFGWDCASNKPI